MASAVFGWPCGLASWRSVKEILKGGRPGLFVVYCLRQGDWYMFVDITMLSYMLAVFFS